MRKAVVSALLYSRSDSTSRERCGLAFSLHECLWVIEGILGTILFCFILLIFVIDVSEFCSLPVIGPGRRKAKLFPRFPLTWWWLEVSHSPGKIPGPCSSHYANNVNCILGCTGSSRTPCPSQRKENSPWGSPRLLWHRLHPTLSPSMPWPHCSSLSQALSASVLVSFALSIWVCCLWPRQFVSNCSQSHPPPNLEPYLFSHAGLVPGLFMGSFSLPCCCF